MRVMVNGQHSPWSMVVSGVPQGSVLGSLPFLLLVNDLPHWIKTSIRMFADDTKIWTQLSHPVYAVQLQMDLDKLSEWSARWLLKFNPQKYKACPTQHGHKILHYPGQPAVEYPVCTRGKDLGVLTC